MNKIKKRDRLTVDRKAMIKTTWRWLRWEWKRFKTLILIKIVTSKLRKGIELGVNYIYNSNINGL